MLNAQAFRQPTGADAGTILLVTLITVAAIVAIGILVSAMLLRAACWLYNKLAGGPGSPNAVPEPNFGKAILISFVTTLVNSGLGFFAGFVGTAAKMPPLLGQAIMAPAAFVVAVAMISGMLPTTLGRALLVALLHVAISLTIVLFFGLVIIVIGAAVFPGRHW
jgi:hypothetical protein